MVTRTRSAPTVRRRFATSPSAAWSRSCGAPFLAYNIVRLELERIADEAQVDPTRISFVTALLYIRDEWLWRCGTWNSGRHPSPPAGHAREH